MPTNDGLSTLDIILQQLSDNGGAILHWQIPAIEADTWELACDAGDILFDELTDCYVHPLAIKDSADGSYSMPHEFER